MNEPFQDRFQAGRLLAARLTAYAHNSKVHVLALPRGGVPVGFEVAKALRVPLDVFIVRKLGVPQQEELAFGAIATGDVIVLNERIVQLANLSQELISDVVARETRERDRRERLYRGERPPPVIEDRIIILVDDGLATGATMRAAAEAIRQQRPQRLVVGVPVAPAETCEEFELEVDEVVCAIKPEPFDGVGKWYRDFSQTTDEEVRQLLQSSLGAQALADESRPL